MRLIVESMSRFSFERHSSFIDNVPTPRELNTLTHPSLMYMQVHAQTRTALAVVLHRRCYERLAGLHIFDLKT